MSGVNVIAGVDRAFPPVDSENMGRNGVSDVIELPDTLPNIVGQIPLEDLDWVVNLRNQRLIPNPEHKMGERYDEFTEVDCRQK